MDGTARKRIGLLAAGAAVLAAASVTSVRALNTPEPDPVTISFDAGVLRLHTGPDGARVTYSGPLDVPATQSISVASKCGVTTDGSLLAFSQTGGSQGIGLVTNGFGPRSKNTCSPSEGRIGQGETLTVGLSSAFPEDVTIVAAELDVEGKFNSKLGVAVDDGGATAYPLASSSDNGPDSGVGDNDRVLLSGIAGRALTFTAVGGEVSLEAGGDGTYAQYLATGELGPIGTSLGTADTILQLASTKEYDHAVACGDTITDTGGEGEAATQAVFTRDLDDGVDANEDCGDTIGVTLAILDNGVLLDKSTIGVDTGEEQPVNSTLQIDWAVEGSATYPLPGREINYEGNPDGPFEPVEWCLVDNGEIVHPNDPLSDTRFEDDLLPWCLVSDYAYVDTATGGVVQVQVYDGKGDPYFR